MNVYDFDKTIYEDDSTVDFILYSYKNFPKCFLTLPNTLFYGLLLGLRIIDKAKFKTELFKYFKYIDVDRVVEDFVALNKKKVQAWYLNQKRPDDLVISASPYFIVNAFMKEYGIRVIATDVDTKTGRVLSKNCYGPEKVVRFKREFKDTKIGDFYSDSYSDSPLANISSQAFLVTKGKLSKW